MDEHLEYPKVNSFEQIGEMTACLEEFDKKYKLKSHEEVWGDVLKII